MKRKLGLLPTPRATMGALHQPSSEVAHEGGGRPRRLECEVGRMLPTPTATPDRKSTRAMTSSSAGEGNGRRDGGGQSSPPGLEDTTRLLAGDVPEHLPPAEELPEKTRRLLPTPTTSDATSGGSVQRTASLWGASKKLLPTPRASDQNRMTGTDHGEGGPSLPGAVHLLPTPSSWLGRRPENASPDPEREASREHEGERGKRSTELPDALAKIPALLPTPSAEESQPTDDLIEEMQEAGINPHERLYLPGRKWHSQRTLSRVIPSLLPTPQAHDAWPGRAARDERAGERGGCTNLNDRMANLEESGKLLPTPMVSDATGGRTSKGKDRPDEAGLRKTVMNKMLPTPTAQSDSRRETARTEEWTSNTGTTLADAAMISSGESTAPRSPGGKSSSGGLRLSPSFVEWMMGAPDGWTDPGCRLSATEFSSRQDGSAASE